MKTFYKILPWALLIIVCFLFWKSCQNDEGKDNVIEVTVTEQSGEFDAVKPEQTVVNQMAKEWPEKIGNSDKKRLSSPDNAKIEMAKLIEKLLRKNDSLSKVFAAIKSDSAKISLYNEVISIREYKNTFEDTAVKIDLSGFVRGEIQSMSCDWKVKERKLPIQVKTWRVLGGVEVGAKQTLDRFGAKANIRYQSAKGSLYSVGIDNTQMIWVGHDIQLFNHTKVK